MQIAAGLRTSGHGRTIGLLLQAASQTPFDGFSANGLGSFPVIAAGQLRNCTGFPLNLAVVPDTATGHKILCFYDGVNDMAADLTACYYIQYSCFFGPFTSIEQQ
jgi:hypothetical protein